MTNGNEASEVAGDSRKGCRAAGQRLENPERIKNL